MNKELLMRLCNADAIAGNEQEVRDIIEEELQGELSFDGLGSMIVRHNANGPKLMFCAHMDEVGFMVRSISDIGNLHLMRIGGVLDRSLSFQKVKVTTNSGKKIVGLMNCSYDANHKVSDIYVDLGLSNAKDVEDLGINIGDMVTFASESELINDHMILAKALDDRIGCYILKEVDRRIKELSHENDVYLCFTSSEEVGTRGGKCVSDIVDPDIVFAIDVAAAPDLVRNYTNQRQIGKGCMIVHYDKTMIPNKKLLKWIKEQATKYDITFQMDMFSGGGTDGANAHLTNGGKLAIVLGIPLRYCHGSYSISDLNDVDGLIELIIKIISAFSKQVYIEMKSYRRDML